MVIRLMLLAAVLLFTAGCATYQTRYVYDDGYYADGVAYEDRDGSRYASAQSGYGDYYVGQREYRYVDSYYYPTYLQWPAYHSLFWGFNRWYHDPFYYPGYYYGVTYFPSNFLSFTSRRGLFMFDVGHRYFPYSPYRNSWYDNYYDWSYWHHNYPSHRQNHREPRYGSARNEAERLAWRARTVNNRGLHQSSSESARLNDRRRADYGNRVQTREDSRLRAVEDRSRQSVQSSDNLRQRGASAPTGRDTRPGNERVADQSRSRALAQRERARKPAAETKPLERIAPDRSTYRAAPAASRTASSSRESVGPRVRERQAAPRVNQIQLRRAYAGSESYQRSPATQQPARSQQRYQRAPSAAPAAAPTPYQRQARSASGYAPPPARNAPQPYSQPNSGVRQQTQGYSVPQQAPQQYREPARAQRSASSTRSESREAARKARDDR